ncbi:hypothetical protein NF212_19020 [Parasalinivibrio latis]|uniref:hypothetical protein n=1 Tax=Parasalinivibrio latis TaxID=2952610 RepID=UPI0030E0F257
MNLEEKLIKTCDTEGVEGDIKIFFEPSSSATIYLLDRDGQKREFTGEDLFKSLKLLRVYFEGLNVKLLCNGSRIDVCPSGMSRSMGRGRKAYLLQLGSQARMENLVDIFDYTPIDTVGTVVEQEQHFDRWAKSLK